MAPPRRVTRELILDEAIRIVEREGIAALTFQALADRLGVSKQAILYWYPSKWDLMTGYSVPEMRKEAEALIGSLIGSRDAADAIERFIRAFAQHYRQRLPQFRLLYLMPPVGAEPNSAEQQAALAPVHQLTASAYAALESWIARDPELARGTNPRQLAVAVHMSAVGLMTMFALADALGDPLVHAFESMVDAMVALHRNRSTEAPNMLARPRPRSKGEKPVDGPKRGQ